MLINFLIFFFFSSRRRHTRSLRDWSSDVCSSDLQAVAGRRVTLTPIGDGMAELWALLPADAAARAYTALDATARAAASPGDPRTADARRADSLVDLITGRTQAPASRVHLTVPLATVLAARTGAPEQPGELAGIGPVPASIARELAADGLWRWLATSRDGTILDAGRRAYRPSRSLAELIRGRDRTCRFPGCRQPPHRCTLA